MSIRNLDALFAPSSIALIGASNEPGSIGSVLAENLFEGGFAGPILTVNPNERAIRSALNYRSVSDLPLDPDLAVIATPPGPVPAIIAELARRGCRAAIVITAGFGEGDRAEGETLMQAMRDAAKPSLLRIVGPNCLGVMAPHAGINAGFAHVAPLERRYRENDRMLRMARDLGFKTREPDEDSDTVTVEILMTNATDRGSSEP